MAVADHAVGIDEVQGRRVVVGGASSRKVCDHARTEVPWSNQSMPISIQRFTTATDPPKAITPGVGAAQSCDNVPEIAAAVSIK
jgi:hypothetical protein